MFEDLIDALVDAAWDAGADQQGEDTPEILEARANLLAAIRELEGRAQQERRPATGKNR